MTLLRCRNVRKKTRKWKQDRIQISYKMWKKYRTHSQKPVETAREKYFSPITSRISRRSKVLSNTIRYVINPSACHSHNVSPGDFLHSFTAKMEKIRSQITYRTPHLTQTTLLSTISLSLLLLFERYCMPCEAHHVSSWYSPFVCPKRDIWYDRHSCAFNCKGFISSWHCFCMFKTSSSAAFSK